MRSLLMKTGVMRVSVTTSWLSGFGCGSKGFGKGLLGKKWALKNLDFIAVVDDRAASMRAIARTVISENFFYSNAGTKSITNIDGFSSTTKLMNFITN